VLRGGAASAASARVDGRAALQRRAAEFRFLGTLAELRAQMTLEATTLEQMYLELTAPRETGT
jgi:hypothetical protein